MKWWVVDASILLRALDEKQPAIRKKLFKLLKAAEASDETQIFAPPLLLIEIANGLRYSRQNQSDAQQLLSFIADLPINITTPTSASLTQALEISYRFGTTAYDAWYHVVALTLGATFVTADKDYYQKTRSLKLITLWE